MIVIHSPELHCEGREAVLSARIETELPVTASTLWFSVPERFGALLSESCDPFLLSLTHLALRTGCDIELRGPVSPRLLYGLTEDYVPAVCGWNPRAFQCFRVRPSGQWTAAREPRPCGVLGTFTGGVDSYYTVSRLRPTVEHRPGIAMTHAFHCIGTDLGLEDLDRAALFRDRYAPILRREGIELIEVKTNIRHHFLDPTMGWDGWAWAFCCVFAAVAHALAGGFCRYHEAAGVTYWQAPPRPSLPQATDRLASETLELYTHGNAADRYDKLASLLDWRPALETLKVCWKHPDRPLENCGRCGKCHRTILLLELLGALDRALTFPSRVDAQHYRRRCRLDGAFEAGFFDELIGRARAAGRPDLLVDLLESDLYRRVKSGELQWSPEL